MSSSMHSDMNCVQNDNPTRVLGKPNLFRTDSYQIPTSNSSLTKRCHNLSHLQSSGEIKSISVSQKYIVETNGRRPTLKNSLLTSGNPSTCSPVSPQNSTSSQNNDVRTPPALKRKKMAHLTEVTKGRRTLASEGDDQSISSQCISRHRPAPADIVLPTSPLSPITSPKPRAFSSKPPSHTSGIIKVIPTNNPQIIPNLELLQKDKNNPTPNSVTRKRNPSTLGQASSRISFSSKYQSLQNVCAKPKALSQEDTTGSKSLNKVNKVASRLLGSTSSLPLPTPTNKPDLSTSPQSSKLRVFSTTRTKSAITSGTLSKENPRAKLFDKNSEDFKTMELKTVKIDSNAETERKSSVFKTTASFFQAARGKSFTSTTGARSLTKAKVDSSRSMPKNVRGTLKPQKASIIVHRSSSRDEVTTVPFFKHLQLLDNSNDTISTDISHKVPPIHKRSDKKESLSELPWETLSSSAHPSPHSFQESMPSTLSQEPLQKSVCAENLSHHSDLSSSEANSNGEMQEMSERATSSARCGEDIAISCKSLKHNEKPTARLKSFKMRGSSLGKSEKLFQNETKLSRASVPDRPRQATAGITLCSSRRPPINPKRILALSRTEPNTSMNEESKRKAISIESNVALSKTAVRVKPESCSNQNGTFNRHNQAATIPKKISALKQEKEDVQYSENVVHHKSPSIFAPIASIFPNNIHDVNVHPPNKSMFDNIANIPASEISDEQSTSGSDDVGDCVMPRKINSETITQFFHKEQYPAESKIFQGFDFQKRQHLSSLKDDTSEKKKDCEYCVYQQDLSKYDNPSRLSQLICHHEGPLFEEKSTVDGDCSVSEIEGQETTLFCPGLLERRKNQTDENFKFQRENFEPGQDLITFDSVGRSTVAPVLLQHTCPSDMTNFQSKVHSNYRILTDWFESELEESDIPQFVLPAEDDLKKLEHIQPVQWAFHLSSSCLASCHGNVPFTYNGLFPYSQVTNDQKLLSPNPRGLTPQHSKSVWPGCKCHSVVSHHSCLSLQCYQSGSPEISEQHMTTSMKGMTCTGGCCIFGCRGVNLNRRIRHLELIQIQLRQKTGLGRKGL